jgi:uncharacterized Zn-binding protein involved in type VI secretion
MGMPAARLLDLHVCPMSTGPVPHVGGPILPMCMVTVLTGKMPQARITDMALCVGPPDMIVKGSATVMVGSLPAARLGDSTAHGGTIVQGFPTVLIGDAGSGSVGAPKMSMVMPKMGAESPNSEPKAQIKTLIAASQKGLPFSEQCARAAKGAA